MKTEIVAKNFKVYEKLEEIIQKKLERLDKYFDKSVKAKVLCKQERDTYILELTIYADVILRAEVSNTEDMYANVDMAVSKLTRQINKHKSKLDAKFIKEFVKDKEKILADAVPEPDSVVVKKKRYKVMPLTVEQAAVKLDLIGHDFFVYQDADSGLISILYKRKDGNLGVIEAEADQI